MTTDTTRGGITAACTAVEAAQLLSVLESGERAAWHAAHEVRGTPEWPSRFAAAAEVGAVSTDAMTETFESGMRQPGETVEQFTARAGHEAEHLDAAEREDPDRERIAEDRYAHDLPARDDIEADLFRDFTAHDPAGAAEERHVLTLESETDEVDPRGYDAERRLGYEGVAEHSLTHDPYEATWAGKGFTRPGPEHEAEAG